MGVKQKTPTPFVGAGSVRTVTPNLSGVGTAIATALGAAAAWLGLTTK